MNEKLISITDVSGRLGVPAHTLRYWEREFPRIIKPTTGNGGRRYYTPEMVGKIEQIKSLLHDKKYTVAGVKKMFAKGDWKSETQEPATSHQPPETIVVEKIVQVPVEVVREVVVEKIIEIAPTNLQSAISNLDIGSAAALLQRAHEILSDTNNNS